MAARGGAVALSADSGGGGSNISNYSESSTGEGSASVFGIRKPMELCEEGRIALWAFTVGHSVVAIGALHLFGDAATNLLFEWWILIGTVYTFAVHSLMFKKYCLSQSGRHGYSDYSIIVRAAFLGSVCGHSLLSCCLGSEVWFLLSIYGVILSVFHFTEYFVTALINPRYLNTSSFLLNQSNEYHIAIIASWVEYAVESYFYPSLKTQTSVIYLIGLCFCVIGELIRKGAMLTAGSNFHHLVRTKREENHRLVTTGIYSICRHPSYAGWFLWSVGTQLLLVNPICAVGYTMVAWTFFRERVEDEEITLLEFFGEDYANYQKRVATGLPFIRGFKTEL